VAGRRQGQNDAQKGCLGKERGPGNLSQCEGRHVVSGGTGRTAARGDLFARPTRCFLPWRAQRGAQRLPPHPATPTPQLRQACVHLWVQLSETGTQVSTFCSPTNESTLNAPLSRGPSLYPAQGQGTEWTRVCQCREVSQLSIDPTAPFGDPAKGTSSKPSSGN